MGQQITVTQKPVKQPGVVVFELNRSLTGMGHERYTRGEVAGASAERPRIGQRPVDVLVRRLFEEDGVDGVHVYSNVVTVNVEFGAKTDHLIDVIRDLFTYYREGVEVADPMAAPS